jgi:hypothetical protein
VKRIIGVPVRRFVNNVWLRPLGGAIPFILLSSVMEKWWQAEGLLTFFIQVALSVGGGAWGLWLGCVPREDRQVSLREIRKLVKRR